MGASPGVRPRTTPVARPFVGGALWESWNSATAGEDPPFAVLDMAGLRANAADLVRRACGRPIRVATKSLRVRGMLEQVLEMPGYAGLLAFTLPEALWLCSRATDVVVGYPTADRAAIAALAGDERAAARVTLMIDSVAQLGREGMRATNEEIIKIMLGS